MDACEGCGGTVAPDGRCWECGRAQAGFRARVEITPVGGAAGVSDRGLVREVNADAMAVRTSGPWTVGVACDGVSMTPRSDRAALLAAEVGASATAAGLSDGALPEVALSEGARAAGRAVARLVPPGAAPGETPPACTYVAAVVGPEGFWCAGIGDSRAYWIPDEGPGTLLTEDDTGADEALTAWLGAGSGHADGGAGSGSAEGAGADAPLPRIRSLRTAVPGRLLLCTDGLWRHLPDLAALRARLRPGGGEPLADARALVAHALGLGGADNITAVVLSVPAAEPAADLPRTLA
ncbi:MULTISPECIES: PP2C family protein-serine/threonine phosphatase [Streptomyces]|uniref:Protein phosphatase 2C domain-containing protein n=1 Tax=Streptomyces solicathayae TaxID=3081768 RepID=A0ABZ0M299_9ACTN|nr:protein phosphatase 2C domain-containing protein [Streptomyces sp. HUAS YS2]WOX25882.1 protein phosphatase 2C domain-containing protein [Streptomyces sp. HUAS YS2]